MMSLFQTRMRRAMPHGSAARPVGEDAGRNREQVAVHMADADRPAMDLHPQKHFLYQIIDLSGRYPLREVAAQAGSGAGNGRGGKLCRNVVFRRTHPTSSEFRVFTTTPCTDICGKMPPFEA